MRVAIIGAGPSGLVTLKYLREAMRTTNRTIEARLFESESSIGGTFAFRTYESAELVSSRQLTSFSDYRLPRESPDFLSAEAYVEYLRGYCDAFDLWDGIELGTGVVSVERGNEGAHVVTVRKGGRKGCWKCDAVAVCSGLHVIPHMPEIEGVESMPVVMHSSEFKSRKQFNEGTDVLILGAGETGMDLSYLAITSPVKSVTLCHRDGFCSAPKKFPNPILNGKPTSSWELPPTDVSSPSLFDTAYVHPILRDSILLWTYYDRWLKYSMWLISGSTIGLDQHVGGIAPSNYHASKMFPNKSSLALPYITHPYRPNTPAYHARASRINISIPPTHGKTIHLAPWPTHFDASGRVHFTHTSRPESAATHARPPLTPDIVIFATGYTQHFPFLPPAYPRPATADVRRIWSSADPSVGFIGFVRPGFGAIPPIAEMQAQLWVLQLLGRVPAPLRAADEAHYGLRRAGTSRVGYGVDYESYVYQLAVDMGAAAGIAQVGRMGWRVFLAWALGGNLVTKFRLIGPWRWEGAKAMMETEGWDTVRRRSVFCHLTLSLIPMCIFGILSLGCYIFVGAWDVLLMVCDLLFR